MGDMNARTEKRIITKWWASQERVSMIAAALKTMKNNRARGLEGIPMELLKYASKILKLIDNSF